MIGAIVAALAIVFFLLWQHSVKKCYGECWDCDTLTVVYGTLIIVLVTGLIYFTQ